MKTSNKLLLTALAVFIISLSAYDFSLRSEYFNRSYKDSFRAFVNLNLRDFKIIDIRSSTVSNVKIIQGPFKVLLDPDAADHVHVIQHGDTLIITSSFNGSFQNASNPYVLVIACPSVAAIHANALYTIHRVDAIIDTVVREDWNMRHCLIEGFKQDSLSVVQNYGSTLILAGDQFETLNATVGKAPASGSKLEILNNSRIKNARINVLNRSRLVLNGETVQNLYYAVADSAKLTLTGTPPNLFNNPKPFHK